MAKFVTYACPGTAAHPAHQFRYLHHPNMQEDPVPRFCPTCGCDSQADAFDQALTMPHLQRPIKGIVDNTYRGMEEGANHRAQVAMEKHGLDQEEASLLKMTDMKDNARYGEDAAIPVNNEVSRQMEQINAARPGTVGFQGAQGAEYSGAVQQGPFPNAGAHAMQGLRKHHAAYALQTGQASAVSVRDAVETTQPGYKKRA